jgi:hypothetical protein
MMTFVSFFCGIRAALRPNVWWMVLFAAASTTGCLPDAGTGAKGFHNTRWSRGPARSWMPEQPRPIELI